MNILVVDDEERLVESLASYFLQDKIVVRGAADGIAAKAMLAREPFDALVTDLRMPKLDGMGLLRWLREEGPEIPVIMISAHGEISDAVTAMKLGAYDYLVKPFDPDELLIRLRKAVAGRMAQNRIKIGERRYAEGSSLVGESPAMKELGSLLRKAAPATSTLLITGESGTGKEVAARLVHELSGREGPFVAVNIGALPEQLMESELFGHEKGAFTGADSRRTGLFEAARSGTLFLDEIGELPLHLQVKLLRAIQEKSIQRLGSVASIPVDIRFIAATNRDLESELKAGRFREDLYYRINVIRLRMPPLRERTGDIALLAGYFLGKLSAELGKKPEGFSAEALALLEAQTFPGNVRELENAVERALILSEGPRIEARDLRFVGPMAAPAAIVAAASEEGASLRLDELERETIRIALRRNDYHREKTAQALGITRKTLLNKMKSYGIGEPER